MTARLEEAFATRLDGLSEETGVTLLAAALDGRASVEEITRAASKVRGEAIAIFRA